MSKHGRKIEKDESLIQNKTLRVRVKDKHASILRTWAGAVNTVWNYVNELSSRSIRERGRFLSEYDIHPYTAGSSKLLGLHSQTVQAVVPPIIGMSCALDSLAKRLVLNHDQGPFDSPLSPKESFDEFVIHSSRYMERISPFEQEHRRLKALRLFEHRSLNHGEPIVTSDSLAYPIRMAITGVFRGHLDNGGDGRLLRGDRWGDVRDEKWCPVDFSISNVELHDVFNPRNESGGSSPAAQVMELAIHLDHLLADAMGFTPTHMTRRDFDGMEFQTWSEEIDPDALFKNLSFSTAFHLRAHMNLLDGGFFTESSFNVLWEQAVLDDSAMSAGTRRKPRL